MKKIVLMVLIMAIMIGGCGRVDETSVAKEKKEENTVEEDLAEGNTENGEEGIATEEDTADVIEPPAETVPVEDEENREKKTQKQQSETKRETEQQVTTPIVSAPTVTPELEEDKENCQHWYQPVETETCTYIKKMTWACNGCGYALYDVSGVDYSPINFSNMYLHPPCETDRFEELCTGGGYHSEAYYYWEGCYECHTPIILRSCTTFHAMAERCVQNESNFGPYEKVETGKAFIKSCDCGKNLMVSDGQTGEGLLLKKEVCSYCGDVKTYP